MQVIHERQYYNSLSEQTYLTEYSTVVVNGIQVIDVDIRHELIHWTE